MKVYDKGTYRDATPEEEAYWNSLPPEPAETPTAEEVLDIMLGGGTE